MSARPVIRRLADLDDVATLSDAAAGTASLRTLGAGAQQASAGNHGHAASAVTSGVFAMARLATGTPNGSQFVRDDGTLQVPPGSDPALAPILAPATSTRNLTVPTADVPASTLRAFATQTQPLWLVEDSGGEDVLRLVGAGASLGDFTPGNPSHAVRLEMPSTGTDGGNPYGPVGITFGGQTYTGKPDPCIFIGYNQKAFEDALETGPRGGGYAVYGVEGNAYWSDTIYRHEMYAEMANAGLTVGFRPLFAQMNTAAGGLPSTRYGEVTVTGNSLKLGVPDDAAGPGYAPGSNAHKTVVELLLGTPNVMQVTGKATFTSTAATSPAAIYTSNVNLTNTIAEYRNNGTLKVQMLGNGNIYVTGGYVEVDPGNVQQTAFLARRNGTNAWFIDTEGHTTWKAGATLTVGTKTLLDADGRLYMTGKYVEVDLSVQDTAFLARRSGVNGWYVDTEGHMTFKDGATIAAGTTNGLKIGTGATNRLAFFGGTARAQPTALTAADAGTVSIVWGATEQAILNNVRTRLNEIAARLNSSATGLSLIAGTN